MKIVTDLADLARSLLVKCFVTSFGAEELWLAYIRYGVGYGRVLCGQGFVILSILSYRERQPRCLDCIFILWSMQCVMGCSSCSRLSLSCSLVW